MNRLGEDRIDEIYNAICDVFLQYNVTEHEVNKIINEAGKEYILSLKKRFKGLETNSDDKK